MAKWILKARDREPNFVTSSARGIELVSRVSDAKRFSSMQEANEFAQTIDANRLSTVWTSRPPELIPVQSGASSFIVQLWANVFGFLGKVSIFWLVRYLLKKVKRLRSLSDSYSFVESWVLFWNFAATATLVGASKHFGLSSAWQAVLAVLGMLRIFEIVIYQVNVILLDEYVNAKNPNNPPYAVRGFRRLVILRIVLRKCCCFSVDRGESTIESSLTDAVC